MCRALLLSILLASLLCATLAWSATPPMLSYQGVLTDDNGALFPDGRYSIEFRLYQSAEGGNPVWSSLRDVMLENGILNVMLGERVPLPASFDIAYWLAVHIVGEPSELAPRTQLAAAPYSLHAMDIADGTVQPSKILNGTVVRSLNGLTEDVNLVGGSNVTITPSGSQLIVDATGGGGADGDWTINGNDIHVAPSGAVGIGTTTPRKIGVATRSLHLLDTWTPSLILEQEAGFSGFFARWFLWPRATDGSLAFTFQGDWAASDPGVEYMVIQKDGSVGIGDNSPPCALSVGGGVWDLSLGEGDFRIGTDAYRLKFGVDANGIDAGDVYVRAKGGSQRMLFGTGDLNLMVLDDQHVEVRDASDAMTVRLAGAIGGDTGGQLALFEPDGTQTVELDAQHAGDGGALLQLRNEAGTTTIDLDADEGAGNHGVVKLSKSNGISTIVLDAQETGDPTQGATLKLYNDLGQLTIELDADNSTSNEGRVITDVLQINGGADLSEQFCIRDSGIEPGMVVSIDPSSPGQLALSRAAYDRRVAGIVSGAGGVRPGMLMGQRGSVADGDYPVALTGRVYCWADASDGSIEPGDLLTTSPREGHAMKATDASRSHGAILGKAMTSLESGRGLVLVLVSLQ